MFTNEKKELISVNSTKKGNSDPNPLHQWPRSGAPSSSALAALSHPNSSSWTLLDARTPACETNGSTRKMGNYLRSYRSVGVQRWKRRDEGETDGGDSKHETLFTEDIGNQTGHRKTWLQRLRLVGIGLGMGLVASENQLWTHQT